jgi:transcriptional regulator with XRE-family HTH domain
MNTMLDDKTGTRNIAINVQQRRIEKGMSRSELARRSGCNPVFISTLEGGEVQPGAVRLKRVADALDTSTDALMAQPSARLLEKAC